MKEDFADNNFDLIRLFAALQVVIGHAGSHLGGEGLALGRYFPGVPIFFLVSGFLISKSYEKNSSELAVYGLNRVLRIYPGLIVCVLLSTGAVYWVSYPGLVGARASEVFVWLLGQVTFLQFYNPEFMRAFSTGVLNGSLWTISVELQFYLLVPILYLCISRFCSRHSNYTLLALIAFFMLMNRIYVAMADEFGEVLLYKLVKVSFIPWFYMFLFGVFAQRNYSLIIDLLKDKRYYLFFGSMGVLIVLDELGYGVSGNQIGPMHFVLLSTIVFTLAFSHRKLSGYLLRKVDISYGIYIYHMPVINVVIYAGFGANKAAFWFTILITLIFAFLSWVLIEKPCLRFKRHALRYFA